MRLLATPATAGLMCAAHVSHAQRDICATGSTIVDPVGAVSAMQCLNQGLRS